MSSGVVKRQHATALRAYKLRQEGLTNRQIADLIGKPAEKVSKWVMMGERLASVNTEEKTT